MSNAPLTTMFGNLAEEEEGWVLFRYDQIWLAAHQSQVRRLMDTRDFATDERRPGCWREPRRRRPAYRLDGRLLPSPGPQRRFAIFLESAQGPIGILCDEIQAVGVQAAGRLHPIPELMAGASPWASGLLRLQTDRVAVVIDPVMLSVIVESVYEGGEDD